VDIKGVVVFCKTCEAINGELKCVVFFFLCVVNLGGVMTIGLCNLFRLKVLCYNVSQPHFWKSVKITLTLSKWGLKSP
jgi:hypothetical protein